MSFKEKFRQQQSLALYKKYEDRITQVQGNVVSVKVEYSSFLWFIHKLLVTVLVRPDSSRSVVKCIYKKRKFFKKPEFMELKTGHRVMVQGLKGKKTKKGKTPKESRETVAIMNVMNLSTKENLIKSDKMPEVKTVRKVQRYK